MNGTGSKGKISAVNNIKDPDLQRSLDSLQDIAESGMKGNMEVVKGGISKKDVPNLSEEKVYFDSKNNTQCIRVGNKLLRSPQWTEE